MMMLVILFAFIATVAAESPSATKVYAKISDTNINGLEGFNLKIDAPFKIQDYVVGFRYALGNFKKAPESLFARKSFDTVAEGNLDLDTEYSIDDNIFSVAAKWTSKQFGVTLGADANTKHHLTEVYAKKTLPVLDDHKVTVKAAYNLLKQKISSVASFDTNGAEVEVKYDTESNNPELTVTKEIDESNAIIPSIKLRTAEITYGYKRSWTGGSVLAKLLPHDKSASLTWKDEGAAGTWVTTAEVPLEEGKNTRVSFAREWNY